MATVTTKCFFCEKVLQGEEANESLCYGCNKYVCEECDVNMDMPFGGHEVEVHRKAGS